MLHQRDMIEGKVVAIWLGDLPNFEAMDEYFSGRFAHDHGFIIDDRSPPELSEPDGEEHGIRELLTSFSFYRDWIEDAVRLCEQAGWQSAKAAAVFYHLQYRPELCQNTKAPMRFVTNVVWKGRDRTA